MSVSKKEIEEIAQWLREAFPKEYKMAPYEISVDARPAEGPKEFAVMLEDPQHKLVYLIPETLLRHIVSDLDKLKGQGLQEFHALEKLGMMIYDREFVVDYNKTGRKWYSRLKHFIRG